MTDSEQVPKDSPTNTNLNKHWKNLDAIFQALLRKYVVTNNKHKFKQLTVELGFDETQSAFLFDSIQTFTLQMKYVSAQNPSLSPYHSSHNGYDCDSNPLFAIPNNKNERLCALKRRRSEIESNDSSDFDESLSENEHMQAPKKKKRKAEKEEDEFEFQNLWQNDANISKKKQNELEQSGVYVIEEIVNHKQIGHKKYEYNVKWCGYNDLSWEPKQHLNPFLVDEYWTKKGMINDKNAAVLYLNERKKNKEKKAMQSAKNKQKKRREKANQERKKEFKCIECDKTFKNGLALGGHKAAKHSKRRKAKKRKEEKVYWEDSDIDDERQMLVCQDSD